MSKWIWVFSVSASFCLGLYIGTKWMLAKAEKQTTHIDVVLEQIKDVFKVVNVEARFSEIFNRKEYIWFDISPLRKLAVIRIQAKVLAGFNMDSIQFVTDEITKTIKVRVNQEPTILAVDHTLDYYDLQQGSFNYFSPEEMSSMQEAAVKIIRDKAEKSDLLPRSKERLSESLKWIELMVANTGWKLEIENIPPQNWSE